MHTSRRIERNLIIALIVLAVALVVIKAVKAGPNPWENLSNEIQETTPEATTTPKAKYDEAKLWPVYIRQEDDLGNTYWKMYYTNFLYKPGEIGSAEIIFKGESYGK